MSQSSILVFTDAISNLEQIVTTAVMGSKYQFFVYASTDETGFFDTVQDLAHTLKSINGYWDICDPSKSESLTATCANDAWRQEQWHCVLLFSNDTRLHDKLYTTLENLAQLKIFGQTPVYLVTPSTIPKLLAVELTKFSHQKYQQNTPCTKFASGLLSEIGLKLP